MSIIATPSMNKTRVGWVKRGSQLEIMILIQLALDSPFALIHLALILAK